MSWLRNYAQQRPASGCRPCKARCILSWRAFFLPVRKRAIAPHLIVSALPARGFCVFVHCQCAIYDLKFTVSFATNPNTIKQADVDRLSL
jgi:hypothetical protein